MRAQLTTAEDESEDRGKQRDAAQRGVAESAKQREADLALARDAAMQRGAELASARAAAKASGKALRAPRDDLAAVQARGAWKYAVRISVVLDCVSSAHAVRSIWAACGACTGRSR